MPKQDASDQPAPTEPSHSLWTPPSPPTLGGREWIVLILERFGFWIVCALTVVAITFLYLNADWIVQSKTPSPPAAMQEAPTEGLGRSVGARNETVEEPEPDGVAGVTLSVTTEPIHAAIFADGDYLGVSPMREVALAEGQHLISVLKPDYIQLDTFVTLEETSVSLQLILATRSEGIPPEALTASDEADRDEALFPALPSEAEPIVATQQQTPPAEDPSDDEPLPAADTEAAPVMAEEPDVEGGELQTGTLRILVKPWGTIYVDGELHKREATIWYTATLRTGHHLVRVEHPSLGRWEQVIKVVGGEERSFTVDFNKN